MGARPLILVVDDDRDIVDTVSDVLGEEGCAVMTASSADDALRLIASGSAVPDVILLDVIMPGMTARRFVSLVRDHATWARTKIVACTGASGSELPNDIRVDGFLRKPFDIEDLMRVVTALRAPSSALLDP